jgi:GNAT superfamily N-acetyltransferase
MRPVEVRRATPEDADELVRLRQVMFDALVGSHGTAGGWEAAAAEVFRTGLADGSVVAYVVDGPDGGLVAGGVATVSQRIPGPGNHSGRFGFVQSMATDLAWRRHGLGRLVFAALMDWFRSEGVTAVDLHASPEGDALYRSFGFAEGPNVELQWRGQAGGSR